jgi:hypothetical protein
MAVIELARPGQEATTYELIITVGNAAGTVSGIIATQLLTPMNSVGCDDDYGNCPSNTVVVTSKSAYEDSNGPERFTNYTLVLQAISITATLIFTPFLPASKEECHAWRRKGEEMGDSDRRGYFALLLCFVTVAVRINSYFSFAFFYANVWVGIVWCCSSDFIIRFSNLL